jgi:hypothetical protein
MAPRFPVREVDRAELLVLAMLFCERHFGRPRVPESQDTVIFLG